MTFEIENGIKRTVLKRWQYPKLHKPRVYVRPGEKYQTALIRWRKRYAEYRDECVIRDCLEHKTHFYRAFYGVQLIFIDPEWWK